MKQDGARLVRNERSVHQPEEEECYHWRSSNICITVKGNNFWREAKLVESNFDV